MFVIILIIVILILLGFYFYGGQQFNKSIVPLSGKYQILISKIIAEFYSNGNILHDENNRLILGVIEKGNSMLFTLKETPDGFLDIKFTITGSELIRNTERLFSFKQETCLNNQDTVIQKLRVELNKLLS
jgi:hypothetical protein